MKLVSVIMPYYNSKEFVYESILSVLDQTYKNLELIIIYDDNNKKDLVFLKELFYKDKRKKIILNKKNLGAGISRNKGIKKSKGEYIAFIDSDDVWKKEKLTNQIKFMEKNNSYFTHSSYEIIDKNSKKIGAFDVKRNLNYKQLLKSCDIGLSSVVLKSEILNKKLFPSIKTKEDYVAWLKLAKKNIRINGINKRLVKWRKTNNSLSSSVAQKLYDSYKVYRNYEEKSFLLSIFHILILTWNAFKKKLIQIYK